MREGIAGSMIGRRAEAFVPEEGGLTRRQALAAAIMNTTSGALATSLVVKAALDAGQSGASTVVQFPKPFVSREDTPAQVDLEVRETESVLHTVPPELVGKTPAGLERRYLGPEVSSGRLPETLAPIDFNKNLRAMLEEKKDIVKDVRDGTEQQRVYERLASSYEKLQDRALFTRMDLGEFRTLIEKETYGTLEKLDGTYDDLARVYFRGDLERNGLRGEEAERFEASIASALEYLTRHITPDIQLAYIATEIMPSPERGAALLSFLLENAGTEFIERIPALGDRELSYGPFQLTPYVIGDDASVTQLLANIRRRDMIPDSLAHFTSMEHHLRAGFLFGVHNLVTLMKDVIKGKRYDELVTLCESAPSGSAGGRSSILLEYLAGAHHRPVVAREAMQTWLEKNKHLPKDRRARTLSGCFGNTAADEQVKTYADKAQQHFMHAQRFMHARNKKT